METTHNAAGHLTLAVTPISWVGVSFTSSPDTTIAGFGRARPLPGIGGGSASTWSEPAVSARPAASLVAVQSPNSQLPFWRPGHGSTVCSGARTVCLLAHRPDKTALAECAGRDRRIE